ncbi:2Fe-2S iron-sulfur cluster-binding protein [Rhodococcus sp. NCIMB 12038]|uniref:2Fe-2S iron-sulfur cluster-binding protein n=1 Tax=Rhodococcus sp. NCIMB 12038 TaxID=933800 RepID=UPI000B3CCA69|nr:2Fe-2S iron-sulfur cluster-binding protein [Rhodococcus sp. NCIMB 12038]OUS92107.1 hypothetical protein CA951_29810 [Rhodococcus sp. NCIMB 12038]
MTEQIAVTVVDKDGTAHALSWREGQSLMEVIRDNGLPISAECGGACACATCHVHLDSRSFSQLPERDEYEAELLEEESTYDVGTSRLACQIPFSPDLTALQAQIATGDDFF